MIINDPGYQPGAHYNHKADIDKSKIGVSIRGLDDIERQPVLPVETILLDSNYIALTKTNQQCEVVKGGVHYQF